MIERFEGANGRRLRVEAFKTQKIVSGNQNLAEELADIAILRTIKLNEVLIVQNDSDNAVYLIFAGNFNVAVNGRIVGRRSVNDHVGEMAAVEPTQKRAASIIATEESVVAQINEPEFAELGSRYPEMYRCIERELARRLLQRNLLISAKREKTRVFIICSVEGLPIARIIQTAFQHEDFLTTIWSDGVFKVTNYTLQSLEDQIDDSDFAIAIAHADDIVESRGKEWPSPRDNVVFELGLFMGRLGRARAILMEPREEKIKLPSDLAGITTIPYKFEKSGDAAALLGPACSALRDHIVALGPNN
jgi:CRP/FNR family cyclic AMP-dependent transcriptional regulator